MTSASPAKWHRAHVTWFFEEFILRKDPSYVVYDETFRYLFNSYYETVGERHPRPDRGLVTRPGVTDITRYREYVDAAMSEFLQRGDYDESTLGLLELGFNHEQQHQELILMDLKHLFSTHHFDPVYVDRPADDQGEPDALTWREVAGGVVEVGTPFAGSGTTPETFAYDNEGPRHRVFLEDFEIAERAVTNADWLDFIADDGYRRHELWLSNGWAHINEPAGAHRDTGRSTTASGRRSRCRGVDLSYGMSPSHTCRSTRRMPMRGGRGHGCQPSSSGNMRQRARPARPAGRTRQASAVRVGNCSIQHDVIPDAQVRR